MKILNAYKHNNETYQNNIKCDKMLQRKHIAVSCKGGNGKKQKCDTLILAFCLLEEVFIDKKVKNGSFSK